MVTAVSVIIVIGIVLGFFIAIGMALASIFCKERKDMLLVGSLIGLGFLFVVGGIVYAGCSHMGGM